MPEVKNMDPLEPPLGAVLVRARRGDVRMGKKGRYRPLDVDNFDRSFDKSGPKLSPGKVYWRVSTGA